MIYKILFCLMSLLATSVSYAACGNRQRMAEYYSNCTYYDNLYPGDDSLKYSFYQAGDIVYYTCANNGLNGTITYVSYIYKSACEPEIMPPKKNATDNNNPIVSCGSVIQASNQVVGEVIPLVGMSFDLVYFSNKVIGRKADYKTNIYLNGSEVSPAVSGYNLLIQNEINSTLVSNSYGPIPSLIIPYEWNGINASSVETWGPIQRTITIQENASDYTMIPAPSTLFLGNLKAKKLGIGGWLPSIWHFYNTASQTLFKGDGSFRAVKGVTDGAYTRIADESGKEVYYFDSTGKIAFTKLGLTGTTIYTFAYDVNERLTTITAPFSKVTTFNRWSTGNLKEIVAPNGKITTVSLDTNGYLSQVINPISEIYSMSYYGTGGLLNTFTVPSGDVTTLTFDSEGNLIDDSHINGFSVTLAKSSGKITTTSSLGRLTETTFVTGTGSEKTRRPSGYEDTLTNSPGSTLRVNPDLYETVNYADDSRFGAQSRVISSIESYNFGRRYSIFSNSTTLTNPSDPFSINTMTDTEYIGSSINTKTYSGLTRTTTSTSKLGVTSKVQVDQYQRPILTQTGNLTSILNTYTNDRLTKIAQGARENNFTYNSLGLLTSDSNSLSQTTYYTYDAAQRLKTKTLPDSRIITYNYDYNGNLTSIEPPSRNAHEMVFGTNDQLLSYQPPLLTGVTNVDTEYTYNNDKQLTKITRPDGKEINLNYDLTTGLLNSTTGLFGTIGYSYQSEKPSLISDQYGHNLNISYTRKQTTGFDLNKNGTLIYTYSINPSNPGGKINTERLNGYGSGSVESVINYSYNDDEYLIGIGSLGITYNTPNGQITETTLSDIKDYYTYNSFGEVTNYQAKYLTSVIYEFTLTRDSIGRVSQKIETLNGITKNFDYVYDSSGRLVEVSTNGVVSSTYVYDDNSNRTGGSIRGESTSATYDDQDRLVTYNTIPLTYTANGELLTKGSASFSYDVFGNLNTYSSGATSLSYEIDPLQRRFGTIVSGTLSSRFIYNTNRQVVGELNNLNKLIKTFIYASKRNVPDYYIDSNGNEFRIITDYLGSVRMVISTAGVVTGIMEHDEFGRVLQDTSPGLLPFGFAGGLYDYRAGFVRFGARDYDPQTGRWTSKDPISFAGGNTNLYGYVLQDPVNLIDPDGKIGIGPSPIPLPLTYPVSPGLITIPRNEKPTFLEKAMFLLYKETTPETEEKILNDFLDNVFKGKDNEYNYINCPRG